MWREGMGSAGALGCKTQNSRAIQDKLRRRPGREPFMLFFDEQ
jgi:hypothetical protein